MEVIEIVQEPLLSIDHSGGIMQGQVAQKKLNSRSKITTEKKHCWKENKQVDGFGVESWLFTVRPDAKKIPVPKEPTSHVCCC